MMCRKMNLEKQILWKQKDSAEMKLFKLPVFVQEV